MSSETAQEGRRVLRSGRVIAKESSDEDRESSEPETEVTFKPQVSLNPTNGEAQAVHEQGPTGDPDPAADDGLEAETVISGKIMHIINKQNPLTLIFPTDYSAKWHSTIIWIGISIQQIPWSAVMV